MSFWRGLLDDAAALSPERVGLHEATAAYAARSGPGAELTGSLVLHDTDLPLVRGVTAPLRVVVGAGAGQLAGPLGIGRRLGLRITGLDVALRDLDDLAGNARRVVAAVAAAEQDGLLGETVVRVQLPPEASPAGWAGAADEVAAAELELTLPLDRTPPSALAEQIDAALDRELPFSFTGDAVATTGGPAGPGILELLLATQRAFDGATRAEVTDTLTASGADPSGGWSVDSLTRGRRWCRSVRCPRVEDVAGRLTALGLLG